MSGITASTPAAPRAVQVFLRNTLEEACGRVIQRLREDVIFSPVGVETLRRRAGELLEAVHRLPGPRQPQDVAPLLLVACSCSLLPPTVLQALARRLLEALDLQHFQLVLGHLQQAVLRERRLAALLGTRDGLSIALHQQLAALLQPHCYVHLHLQLGYPARLTTAAAPEDHQTQHVDLALGEGTSSMGCYITICRNPQDMRALQAGQAPLHNILAAERVSAPGDVITGPRGRACMMVAFYSAGELGQGNYHHREAILTGMAHYSTWEQVANLYEAAWGLPPRVVGASILPLRPGMQ